MSSAGGSVLPSGDQPPPLSTKKFACFAPSERSGSAKWYAPRIMPTAWEPSYCWAKCGLRYPVPSVALT